MLTEYLNKTIQETFPAIQGPIFQHVNLGQHIKEKNLIQGWDQEFDCSIFDSDKVVDYLEPFVGQQGGYIVDFHTADFFPERYFDLVVLLRVNNTQLHDRLQ